MITRLSSGHEIEVRVTVSPERIEEAYTKIRGRLDYPRRETTFPYLAAVEALDSLAAALREARAENERLREALGWCGGSADFAPGGEAREGWEKIVLPLLAPADEAKR